MLPKKNSTSIRGRTQDAAEQEDVEERAIRGTELLFRLRVEQADPIPFCGVSLFDAAVFDLQPSAFEVGG